MTTLIDRLRVSWQERPDDVALVMIDPSGEREIPFSTFLSGAAACAHEFNALGLRHGDLVVLVQDQGESLLCHFWGAMIAGAIPSIFPFLSDKLDPTHYFNSVRQLVERSGVALVVAEPRFQSALEQTLAGLDVRIVPPCALTDVDPLPLLDACPSSGDDTAFLQHSSGSTGLQKGVMLSHAAVLNQLDAYRRALDLQPSDVVVSWLPLYHDMGLIAAFMLPLVLGLKLVLMSPFHWVRDPQILLQAISQHGGTLCWQPNFAYRFLSTRIRDSALSGIDLSSWRAAINCSEPVFADSQRQFLQRFAPYGLRPESLLTCYAMAENTFAVTQSALGAVPRIDVIDTATFLAEQRALPAAEGREVVSCGRPIAGCEVQIVTADCQPLPERHTGEIRLRSSSMLTGYYHQPELSAKALKDGWLLTGDLGYIADGELYVTGRKKDLIIVGGKNIYPQDIESLLNDIKGIYPGRNVAFGVLNDRLGTEDIVVVAEVTTDGPDALAAIEREIRARVTQTLDVTVRYVRLVDSRWLIKTSSGKVARAANRDKFLLEQAH